MVSLAKINRQWSSVNKDHFILFCYHFGMDGDIFPSCFGAK